jgi:hypothetical protein
MLDESTMTSCVAKRSKPEAHFRLRLKHLFEPMFEEMIRR